MKKIIITLGILFLILIIIVYFQANSKSINNFLNKSTSSTITINSAIFTVELAKTPKEQVQGLSGRGSLSKDAGMLFIFDKPSYYSFWMRGMKFPLDIIFILDNKVVAIYENLQPALAKDENPPQYGLGVAADKVLEINAGESAKNNITLGDDVAFELK